MKKIFIILILCTLTAFVSAGFYLVKSNYFAKPSQIINQITMSNTYDYDQLWMRVDSLVDKQLPKDALAVLAQIDSVARSENEEAQIVKVLIYKFKLKVEFEDMAFETLLVDIQKEAEIAPEPLKQILYSLTGQFYQIYISDNYYDINQRTEVINSEGDDISLWSGQHLFNEAEKYFLKSLENENLTSHYDYKKFKAVMEPESFQYNISLYDILAKRLADFYLTNSTYLVDNDFSLSEKYFCSAEEFIKLDFGDAKCVATKQMKFFQKMLSLHNDDKDKSLFAHYSFLRVQYLRQYNPDAGFDSAYVAALDQISQSVPQSDVAANALYSKARVLSSVNSSKSKLADKLNLKRAHDILKDIQKNYLYFNPLNIKENIECIEAKKLSFQMQKVVIPHSYLKLFVNYANIDSVYFRVASINSADYEKIMNAPENYRNNAYTEYIKKCKKLFSKAKTVAKYSYKVVNNQDFNMVSSEILLPSPDLGFYVVFASPRSDFEFVEQTSFHFLPFAVSDLCYGMSFENSLSTNINVFSRTTGKPLSGVNVEISRVGKYDYSQNSKALKVVGSGTTDVNGIYKFDASESYRYFVNLSSAQDKLYDPESFTVYSPHQNTKSEFIKFFIDRAIYRPGQTVKFKILYFNSDDNKATVLTGKKLDVNFKDANFQKISQLSLITNEFGTAWGEFKIPENLLNGRFSLSCGDFSTWFSIEEYKIPKFEVELQLPQNQTSVNDTVTITGKATSLTGVSVRDSKVSFTVRRKPIWHGWYFMFFDSNTVNIAKGETITDANGNFKISFVAQPDNTIAADDNLSFDYEVTADVTDISGETRSASKTVGAGYTSMFLNVDLPDIIVKDFDNRLQKVSVSAVNADNVDVDADIDIKIYKVADFEAPRFRDIFDGQYCSDPIYTSSEFHNLCNDYAYSPEEVDVKQLKNTSLLKEFKINTSTQKFIDISQICTSGNYSVEVSSKDFKGKTVKSRTAFGVVSKDSDAAKFARIFWTAAQKTEFMPGEKFTALFGTSLKNVNLYVNVFYSGKLQSNSVLSLNQESKFFNIDIPQINGNILIKYFYIINNHKYSSSYTLNVDDKKHQLNVEFTKFRDKLMPGENETWTFKITDFDAKKVDAEMVATLYDSGLDAIERHEFRKFSVLKIVDSYVNFELRGFDDEFNKVNNSVSCYFSEYYVRFPDFNLFGFGNNYYDYEVGMPVAVRGMATMSLNKKCDGADFLLEEAAPEYCCELAVDSVVEEAKPVEIRQNFAETALFEPHILSDNNGDYSITFTIPQSLTRWQMYGFAHTSDMKIGYIQNKLVTMKDFTVEANLPRFFRSGDKVSIPVKITDLSDSDLNGSLTLEILDFKTLQPVKEFKNQKITKDFSVESKNVAVQYFDVEIPQYTMPIVVKVTGISGKVSDGEQRAVPVLTDKILVTDVMALPVSKKQTADFVFKSLDNIMPSSRFTLEFTSNPAWYAVDALSYLNDYPYDCYEQLFSKYYSNALADAIVKANPRIKKIIEQRDSSDINNNVSNLLRNQELKSALIEQTPWVNDADNETERIHNLKELFDENKINADAERILKILLKGQKSNGGWPWYDGFPESEFVTSDIVTGLGRLIKLDVPITKDNGKILKMVKDALEFLDNRSYKKYQEAKRYYKGDFDEKYVPDYSDLMWLYAHSFFPKYSCSAQSSDIYNLYMSKLHKHYNKFSIRAQAMIALTLNRQNQGDPTAATILESFRQRATYSDELGMSFKENTSGYFWYNRQIETQAAIIEAFDEIQNDQKSVDLLRVWLIKNKQTNNWETTTATSEAVYALFRGNSNLLSENFCDITVGSQLYQPAKMSPDLVQPGTGYFKTVIKGGDIKPDMKNIKVVNPGEMPAYGAVYHSYFQDINKVEATGTSLKISKKIFLQVSDQKGKLSLKQIDDKSKIHVGDKITVRFEIKNDRDLEYVHIKDMRASGTEPLETLSGVKYNNSLLYYQSISDAAHNFFVEYLPKGNYVFEYPLIAVHQGIFSSGIATIQCMYAPEFASRSGSVKIEIVK